VQPYLSYKILPLEWVVGHSCIAS